MQRDVELGPEDLVDRAGRAHVAAVGEPGHRAPGVEAVGLRLDPGVHDRVGESRGRGALRKRSTSRSAAAQNRPGERSDSPRSLPAVLIATRQPSPGAAEHVGVRHEDVVEEDLGEAGLAVQLGDRSHGDARRRRAGRGSRSARGAARPRGRSGTGRSPSARRWPASDQVFWPLRTQPPRSSSRRAVERRARPGRSRPRAPTSTAPRSVRRSPSTAGSGPAAPGCRGRR